MNILERQIQDCRKCGDLPKLTKNYLQIGKTNILILGESPAKDGWIESGKAFYNKSGKLQQSGKILEKLLNLIDLKIEDVYFTEICKCIIEERRKLEVCSNNCIEILKKQMNNLDCNLILTMGLHPTQAILETKIKKFADYVGKVFKINFNGKEYTLIPIYHPSPANPKGFQEICQYLKQSKHC